MKIKSYKLCKSCILPENFAGITFNEKGICNLCENYEPIQYLGKERLKKDVDEILKNKPDRKYDCVVGLSGGRDSTYLLWYVVNVLKLKPLALFVDSKLIPKATLENINNTVKQLDVDLIVDEHEYLLTAVPHFLSKWVKYPHPATLITLCTGCRLGLLKLLYKEATEKNIPIIFEGGTPFEEGSFKKDLLSSKSNNNISFLTGYGKQILKNPALISNPRCLKIQFDEFMIMPWGPVAKFRKQNYVHLEPFRDYFRWEEKKIEATIRQDLNWQRYPGMASSYRGDCDVGIIRQYLYNKLLGYNDKDDHLSWLIRDGQITRKEALNRIEKEKETSQEILRESFKKLGMDFDEFKDKLERNLLKISFG